jgi:hypothetical protein
VPAAPAKSPFGQSISPLPFTMADHGALLAFRRRLRRKAVWVVVTPTHSELPEAVEVYRPFEVPERAIASWTLWRSAAGVWLYDKVAGPLGEPTTMDEALEIVEAILKTELRKAIRTIPLAGPPKLPRLFRADSSGSSSCENA